VDPVADGRALPEHNIRGSARRPDYSTGNTCQRSEAFLEGHVAKVETTRISYTIRQAGLFPPCAERSLELVVETLSTSGIISWELA
jgi:hypothetical protein